MFKDAFIKLDAQQAQNLTQTINPFLDRPFDVQKTSVMIHDLSFYKGYFLAELSRHDHHPPIIRSAICNNKGDVHVLSWTNTIIFELNNKAPIDLNENNMMEYIHFFFTYVKGKHGRFLVIESVDDIDWRDEPSPAGRKALAKMISPIHLISRKADGTYEFKACVIFKDSLFQAEIHLKKDGHIVILNEELLVEDIPVANDVFGQ